jgi:type IV pilus assembly protein PilM
LPGLRRYLTQSLGFEILRTDKYEGLVGSAVTASPIFQENVMSFGVCYGLALQGLGRSGIHTNLLPREIIKDRMIRRKKPWAVAAAASLLLGCAVSCGAYALNMGSVDPQIWKTANSAAEGVVGEAKGYQTEATQAEGEFTAIGDIGKHLISNVEGRLQWLEMLKAIAEALPQEDPKTVFSKPLSERNQIFVKNLEAQHVDDVSSWFSGVKKWYIGPAGGEKAAGNVAPAAAADPSAAGSTTAAAEGPTGEGWIVKIEAYHYHNEKKGSDGEQYVRDTLIKNLMEGEVELPTADRKGKEKVSLKALGISYPLLFDPKQIEEIQIPDPSAEPETSPATPGAAPAPGGVVPVAPGGEAGVKMIKIKRFPFQLMFCWQPKLPTQREEEREKAKKEKASTENTAKVE